MLSDYDRSILDQWDADRLAYVDQAEFVAGVEKMTLSGMVQLRDRLDVAQTAAHADLEAATARLMHAISVLPMLGLTSRREAFIPDGATRQEVRYR